MTRHRWAWTEIDASAILANVEALRSLLAPSCRLMAVVKADGYGHGAAESARAALAGGASELGVATVDEALSLRNANVTAPLLILAEAPPESAGEIVDAGVTATVASRSLAVALSEAATRAGRQVGFHLKVDTGMHRIGVAHDRAGEFLTSLRGLPGLALHGVFTHFATAEVPGDWDFEKQMDRLQESLSDIREAGFEPGVVHASNSAATILHREAHFDMVRCGISIYGLHPGEATRDRVDLRSAMSVKARVAAVRTVPMGEGVSYGLIWRAAGPVSVATIPLGYADGVHRVLSGNMRVLIGGRQCEQVGRICMDQLMVEVPRGLSVSPGDEVVIVGEQGSEVLAMDEMAASAGTINYEMACGFALRLERRFV